ncbi:hypothetical protein ACLB2K_052066 [Fragaria x ananassa]
MCYDKDDSYFICPVNYLSRLLFLWILLGVSYQTDDAGLREAFGRYGDVVDARIITDHETGRSRGFGFVTYATPEEASSAIQGLDGKDLHGRIIRVNYATDRPRGNFSYGGGDGGYSGGGDGGYGGGSYGGSYGGSGSYSGGRGGGSSYSGGGGGGGYNSFGNDSYSSAGNYGSGNSLEIASGGGFGNNTNFGPPSGVGTGGADNFGVGGGGDNSFPDGDNQFGYQNRA